MSKNRKKSLITVLAIIFILIIGLVIARYDFEYFHIFNNNEAGCVNCLSQVGLSMRMYSNEYDGHFPAGKDTPLDSLALLEKEGFLEAMTCYTSHALGQKLRKYYKKHKKIPTNSKSSCYRFNYPFKKT